MAVVVTFRRTDPLRQSIGAILAQTRPPDHVLVVDNGGVALTALGDLGTAPGLEVVETGENLGPAGGYELGFRLARERGADKIWTVDDDVVPEPGCLAELLAASRGADVVVPRQVRADGYARFPPAWTGPAFDVRAVERVGLPRADLFFWCEDTEYFDRLRRAEVPVRRVPGAQVLHLNPAARRLGAPRDWRVYYEVRNALWLRLRARDRSFLQVRRALWHALRTLLSIIVLERNKRRSLRLWWMAVRDFAAGRLGRRVDPDHP